MSVFAACRSLLPFAFDLVTHNLLERRARRQREACVQQYCTGYDIGALVVRRRPFRPIRLRIVERVQMLAGEVITGRSCRPIVPTGRPVRCIAVCSQRQIHVCIEQQLDDVWKAAAGGIRVR